MKKNGEASLAKAQRRKESSAVLIKLRGSLWQKKFQFVCMLQE